MIELDNRTDFVVDLATVKKISASLTKKEIELILTTSEDMRAINLAHRDINKDTDVLSFPYQDMPMAPLGSIVISVNFIKNKAKELEHSANDEFNLLFIHGLLHLLGYDHETDNGEMRNEEKKLIEKFNLPTSLIVRNEI